MESPEEETSWKREAQHCSYQDMSHESKMKLKEHNGSSRQKIYKNLAANFIGLGDESSLNENLNPSVKKLLQNGTLLLPKGFGASRSIKLVETAKKRAPWKNTLVKKSPRRKAIAIMVAKDICYVYQPPLTSNSKKGVAADSFHSTGKEQNE